MKNVSHTPCAALLTVLLSACATPPPATVSYPAPPAPAPVVAAPAPAVATPVRPPPPATPAPVSNAAPTVDSGATDRALQAAVDAYDRGDFAAAIRQLNPLVNDGALDNAQQVRALKVLAFSQCSSNALTACQQSFEKAFKVDANFDLLAAERGHPIWGARFLRARRAVLGK